MDKKILVPLTSRQIDILVALAEAKLDEVDNTSIAEAIEEVVEVLENAEEYST